MNENIASLPLTAKFGVPICPHADGVGLCEIVHHLSMSDYVALSAAQGASSSGSTTCTSGILADPG